MAHSDWPLWISHHTPTYLPGLIHDVSPAADRARIVEVEDRASDSIRSPGVSPMTSVRQGELCGAVPRTLTPSGSATRAERQRRRGGLAGRHVHRGVVDQVGLVQGRVAGVARVDRDRCRRGVHRADGGAAPELLVAAPGTELGGDPPRREVVGEVELGVLRRDREPIDRPLPRQHVAEADAVVEDAEDEPQRAPRRDPLRAGRPSARCSGCGSSCTRPTPAARRRRAGRVARCAPRGRRSSGGASANWKPSAEFAEQRSAVVGDAVLRPALLVELERERDPAIRRRHGVGRRVVLCGTGRRRDHRQRHDRERDCHRPRSVASHRHTPPAPSRHAAHTTYARASLPLGARVPQRQPAPSWRDRGSATLARFATFYSLGRRFATFYLGAGVTADRDARVRTAARAGRAWSPWRALWASPPSTVSNAFNRPERLSPALRERVRRTAAELGDGGPDPVARSLRSGRAGAIGVVFRRLLGRRVRRTGEPGGWQLLRGLLDVTDPQQLVLVLVPGLSAGAPRSGRRSAAPRWTPRSSNSMPSTICCSRLLAGGGCPP